MSNYYPNTDFSNAGVEAFVDVYPLTGGSFTLTGSTAQILSLSTNKFIRGQSTPGVFSFQLAPGGPNGVNGISWTQIITQFSLCIISLRRGSSNQVAMIGVVDTISENQSWSKTGVKRNVNVTGYDFSTYLMNFAYYVQSYLGLIQADIALGGPPGTEALFNNGLATGSPAEVGAFWFKNVFLGPPNVPIDQLKNAAALASTYLRYQGHNYYLNQLWSGIFEELNLYDKSAISFIPFLSNFLISEGSFWSKFADIFPWPFYEMFVNTVPVGYYKNSTAPSVTFTPSVSGLNPAQVYLVARQNPLPWISLNPVNPNISDPKWVSNDWDNTLDTFILAVPISFISSNVKYTSEDFANFYVIDPTGIITSPGDGAGNIKAAIVQMGFMYDQSSMNRYGFRSNIHRTMWWLDPTGSTAVESASNPIAPEGAYPGPIQYIAYLSRFASVYEPLPNMLSGEISFPLWPDLIVGNKFQCTPFKESPDNQYTFYMTGIHHDFVFGGSSISKVTVERGLKTTDYEKISEIMIPLHLGQIDRVDGLLTLRAAPGRGLTYVQGTVLDYAKDGAYFLANGTGSAKGF